MPDKHAVLSASSSHRWLACPPSALLCAKEKDKPSEFAIQGTDAHTLCEYKLKTALGQQSKDPIEDLTFFDEEMADCTDMYAQYVMGRTNDSAAESAAESSAGLKGSKRTCEEWKLRSNGIFI